MSDFESLNEPLSPLTDLLSAPSTPVHQSTLHSPLAAVASILSPPSSSLFNWKQPNLPLPTTSASAPTPTAPSTPSSSSAIASLPLPPATETNQKEQFKTELKDSIIDPSQIGIGVL